MVGCFPKHPLDVFQGLWQELWSALTRQLHFCTVFGRWSCQRNHRQSRHFLAPVAARRHTACTLRSARATPRHTVVGATLCVGALRRATANLLSSSVIFSVLLLTCFGASCQNSAQGRPKNIFEIMPSQELILVLPYTLVRHISHATFFFALMYAALCGELLRQRCYFALQRSQTTLTLHAAGFVEFNLTKKKDFVSLLSWLCKMNFTYIF